MNKNKASSSSSSGKAKGGAGKVLRGRRACLVCGLVKSFEQFIAEGCTNCDDLLRMRGHKASVYAHSTNICSGFYILMESENGWTPGLYAISVVGQLPPATLNELHRRGIPYRARAQSG